MFSYYVPRYANPVAACIGMLMVAWCVFNNLLFLITLAPACIAWARVANLIGRRRLIRLATGSAKGWHPTLIGDRIDSKDAKRITRSVTQAKRRHQSIAVFIRSGGGSVIAAQTIIDALKAHNGRVVFIIVERCMSAATFIACSFPQNDRFAVSGSSIMIHAASLARISDKEAQWECRQEAWVRLNELVASESKKLTPTVNSLLLRELANGSRLSVPFLAVLFATGGDLHFSPRKACQAGLIGNIIHP